MRFVRFAALILPVLAVALLLSRSGSAQEAETPGIWLPWEGGGVWRYINGPHAGSGLVLDALDFQPPDAAGKQCETFTSAFWAVAAADGRATVLPNAVEVDHGGGFRTGYYHLADKQVKTGDAVKAGQRLGRPGCCPDGDTPGCWATEPHLHFYTATSGGRRPIFGTLLGGWFVDIDGCLVRPERRVCPGGALISNAPRFEGGASQAAGITVAIDVSGSMGGPASGDDVLRLVAPYLRAVSEGKDVTVVAFNSHARVVGSGPDKPRIEELAKSLRKTAPDGDTDLVAGLSLACEQMKAHVPGVKQALVLVSGGYQTGDPPADPERCFKEQGWPVFALGLGRANAELLGHIASATGGEYRPAGSIFDPACEMERVRATMAGGERTPCNRFLLQEGERLSIPLQVPPEQGQMSLVMASLPVADAATAFEVHVSLRMPGRKPITDEMALAHESDGRTERYAVGSPAAGEWEAVITGRELPRGGVLVDLAFGTMPVGFSLGQASSPTPQPERTVAPDGGTPTPSPTQGADTTETPEPSPTLKPRPTVSPPATPTPTPKPTAAPR